MARYKDIHCDQDKFIPISFQKQILPGTFEHTLSYLIDHELDLSVFEARYHNDDTGAPAFDPAVLLKIVIYAYSRGTHKELSEKRDQTPDPASHATLKVYA